ncbi:MAG: hypothetical protein ACE5LV_08880 [Candidatus Aminicenantales bacterium]
MEDADIRLLGQNSRKTTRAREHPSTAIDHCRQAVSNYEMNIFVLNALGDFFSLRNGRDVEASWEKSLELNPDQCLVREKLASFRKKK